MVDEDTVRQGFIRQRRSLIAITLALLAFQSLDATLSQVRILGNDIDLSRPLNVATPLWIAWFYFFARYYQHFRDLADPGFGEAVQHHLKRIVRRIGIKLIRDDVRQSLSEEWGNPKISVEVKQFDLLHEPPGQWRLRVSEGLATIQTHTGALKIETQVLNGRGLTFPPGVPKFGRIRAFVWVVLHTRFGTEYVLPFVLGALPPFVAFWKMLS